jgi:predicted ATPase
MLATPSRSPENNWYVITGAPSSGKTTLINALAQRGYMVSEESARAYILEELGKGKELRDIRKDILVFQREILKRVVEKESKLNRDEVIFLDRGVPDTRGFLMYNNVPEPRDVKEVIDAVTYRKAFMLDTLPLAPDNVRTEDEEAIKGLDKALEETYRGLGIPLIRVPVMPNEDRVDFVLRNL